MDDNPNLSREFIEAQKNMYTGVFYERYILGRWVTAESSIYRDVLGPQCKYDDASRPVALLTSPAERYIFVDYGTVNPCVFLDVYGDGKTLYQEREYYWDSVKMRQQKTDSEYGDDFDAFVGSDKRGLVVIVDPSAASFKLELVRRGYQVKNGENEVLEGIRRVSSALKQGIYKIHARCVETLKEHEGYAWNKKAAKRGEEEPIKEHDHTCFVAGTMIDAPNGPIPIEQLALNSIISTPLGNCRVLKIADRIASCVDNGILLGTADHPIYMKNKWTRLDAMRYNVLCESNPSHSTESFSGAIQTQSVFQTETTFARILDIFGRAYKLFMSRYGRVFMGLYHPNTTSTTLTRIQETTIHPTLDVCRDEYICRSTGKTILPILSIWQRFAHSLKNGTHLPLAPSGITTMLSSNGSRNGIAKKSLLLARNAETYSKHGEWLKPITALIRANVERVVNRAWMMSPKFARFVASHLWQIKQIERFIAVEGAVLECGRQTVYALTTEHGCYIANGILVSNCDAARVGICKAIPKWRLG